MGKSCHARDKDIQVQCRNLDVLNRHTIFLNVPLSFTMVNPNIKTDPKPFINLIKSILTNPFKVYGAAQLPADENRWNISYAFTGKQGLT